MSVWLWLAAAWLVGSSVTAVVIGAAIRLAEERDLLRRGAEAAAATAFPIELATPRSADTRRRFAGHR